MINPNNPYGANYGYSYGVQRPQARNTQPLTPEQIAKLRQNSNAFDMKVEPEDLWRAACTHKEKNGQSALIQNADGSYTCTICHEKFEMSEKTPKEVQDATDLIINILQTIKTIYLDAPEELIKQYMQLIAILKKLPQLWDRAISNFSMYDDTTIPSINPMSPAYSGFAALNSLMAAPYAAYGNGYMAPAYPAAPAPMAPTAYAPQPYPDFNNPMAYTAPAPVAPMPGTMPTAAPAPVAPAPVAPAPAEVQQQQVFNV